MKTNNIVITEIQHFCMHDGPGIRTTVFFKGCPLHCLWCHNPETQWAKPQILFTGQKCIGCGQCEAVCPMGLQTVNPERKYVRESCIACGKCASACPAGALTVVGKEMTAEEIIRDVQNDAAFYGETGGLTVSGGEPFYQPEGLKQLLMAAKKNNISVCVETSGITSPEALRDVFTYVELFLFDIKDTDEVRLKENTGGDFTRILNNLLLIDGAGKNTVLRCVLIPEVNLNDSHLQRIAEIYGGLKHCYYVELLPYHPFGESKAEQLGIMNSKIYEIPDREKITEFALSLRALGVPVKCFGEIV